MQKRSHVFPCGLWITLARQKVSDVKLMVQANYLILFVVEG